MIILLCLFAAPETLPDTKPLTMKGDLAAQMVEGVDRFLLKQIERAAKEREARWKRDFPTADDARKRLTHLLGVRDKRHPASAPELVATLDQPALVGKGKDYDVFAIRWKAFADVHGEGLMLVPRGKKPAADVIAIPDADVTPEQLCGLIPGVKADEQYARRFAESGCRVIVPTLIPRRYEARNGRAKMTDREFLYRPAFEMGRHLIGYELQKVLALVDWLAKEKDAKVGVIGYGEGGMLALYAAALDTRIKAACVSGYAGGDNVWEAPIDRNVFGLLTHFGSGELCRMVAPRGLVLELSSAPKVSLPSEGGAPGVIDTDIDAFVTLARKVNEAGGSFAPAWRPVVVMETTIRKLLDGGKFRRPDFPAGPGAGKALDGLLGLLDVAAKVDDRGTAPEHLRKDFDPEPRRKRQFDEIDRHNQQLLEESPYVRKEFMKKLDTSSPDKYAKSVEWYRDYFANEVVGRFDLKPLPFNARTKKISETKGVTTYQVILDVYDDVFAYGLLLIPDDLKPGEKRPVVVCQHGLEGRPEHVIGKEGFDAYKAFATRLAERGFITFAPQNLYIGKDKFRTLQRKANTIGKTLFSVIVPQHQQITDWLKTLPNVDGERIAFYGLSYGGKTAMRVPPLVKNYCLSICSADFNDWVWKNASSRSPYSYVWTMEYEIFEWDLGSTFNYSEMAAMIAPRPFMVERGHFDGVAPDERVAYEFAKVRNLYQARLGIGERTEIEWFVGPHTINGKGTFDFLHKHLKWAKR